MTVPATNNISINRVTENLDLTLTFSMDAVAEARREVLRLYDIISAMEKPVAPMNTKNFSSNDSEVADILNDAEVDPATKKMVSDIEELADKIDEKLGRTKKADKSEVEESEEEPKKTASTKTRTRKSRTTKKAEEPVKEEPAAEESEEQEESEEEPKKTASTKTRTRKSRTTKKAEELMKEESKPEPETEEPEEAADDDSEEEEPLTIKEIRKLAHDCADGSPKGRMEVKKALRKYTKVGAMAGLQEKDYTAFYNDLVDIYYSLHPEEAEDAEEE